MAAEQSDFIADVLAAWNGRLEISGVCEAAAKWQGLGQGALAAVLYRTWLERNNTPWNHLAHFNHGAMLFHAGDVDGAALAYQQAIELAPDFLRPHFNLGLVREKQGRFDAAVDELNWVVARALETDPEEREIRRLALNNLGRMHEERRNLGDALACLEQSLAMDPGQGDVLHHWVFLRAKMCHWPVYAPVAGVDPQFMRQSTSALAMIALSDDPLAQLAAARKYVREKVKGDVAPLAARRAYGHRRLRIGYLSSDLCLHPVALLTAQLFELHDREHFEVYAYCWTREDGSALRRRVIAAMDHFVRIDTLDDAAAARRIREDEIDVLIDLHGQTLGARADILALRPAPIQITYLGLPATTGLPCIDYVIADRFLIPEDAQQYYSERPLYLPDVYQVSDRQRAVGAAPRRADCGLPDDAFVFCSFNNNFKYTPEMFATWMRILRRVPNSVLWLLSDNPWAEQNLRQEALRHGLDASRLRFAGRVAPHDYLARFGVADLFLDTYPFNAGTTANDALWMELPIVTLAGPTFASRMAGALLTAAGLSELVTYRLADYEEKAVALAGSPQEIGRMRATLRQVKADGALFDIPRLVRNLEAQLTRLVAQLPH